MTGRRSLARSSLSLGDVYTQAAYLLEQRDYELAERFLAAVENAYDRLAEMPGLGVPRDFGRRELKGLRMWRVPEFPKYLTFYRFTDASVEIARVIHGSQDVEAILTSD